MARDKDATGRRTGGPEAQLRQKTKEREGRGSQRGSWATGGGKDPGGNS